MTLNELTNKAYSLYPLNIKENDLTYKDSQELKNLTSNIKENKIRNEKLWAKLLSELKKDFSDGSLDEIPNHALSRCFMAQIYIRYEKGPDSIVNEEKILFFISLIIPYYAFCSSINRYDRNQTDWFRKRDFIIKENHKSMIDRLERAIIKCFPTYSLLPPEYAKIIFPGIKVEDSTYLIQESIENNTIGMTLFHAYFTTNLI